MQTSIRKVIDCREFPSDINCSLTITGTEDEVIEAASEHAVSSHGQYWPDRSCSRRCDLPYATRSKYSEL